ncbi:MAG: fluoride efflux transporter CrcB [Bacteroidetes bacterium]|nr:fluoride efflux transporter CrcB [Bacteroidota bacterium]
MNYLLVFTGGGIGSLIRYGFGILFSRMALQLPYATFCANITSCLLFSGLLYMYETRQAVPEQYRLFILVGICGGLSTFSTFSFETFELLRQHLYGWAAANVILSIMLCTAVFFVFSK